MYYTLSEIKENKDIINDLTLDIYDIFADLKKMLSFFKYEEGALEEEIKNFKLDNNSSMVRENLERFSVLLSYLLFKYGKTNKTFSQELNKYVELVKSTTNLKEFYEEVYLQYGARDVMKLMSQIFNLFKLDGTSKDLLVLLEFNLFDDQIIKKLDNTTFQFHPFNGCDAPL
ncbi:hypothetical protein [Mycoplasma crocodyli]|uniref:Uncharacterized protein n=1 Tax=Mycoplasma crocodyli (strain ATCC 51981 / MP145) TaxID=512564 RepID=D5E659_MYCCM|nr:hypothetical protein [Mycoplasma crocodyli]ADE19715.1 hypothetical protein MCRO_0645 [Mycoplasma crocodyli MP145]